jgi:hypothetical protein
VLELNLIIPVEKMEHLSKQKKTFKREIEQTKQVLLARDAAIAVRSTVWSQIRIAVTCCIGETRTAPCTEEHTRTTTLSVHGPEEQLS